MGRQIKDSWEIYWRTQEAIKHCPNILILDKLQQLRKPFLSCTKGKLMRTCPTSCLRGKVIPPCPWRNPSAEPQAQLSTQLRRTPHPGESLFYLQGLLRCRCQSQVLTAPHVQWQSHKGIRRRARGKMPFPRSDWAVNYFKLKVSLFLLSGNGELRNKLSLVIKNEESYISVHLSVTINLKPNGRSIQKRRNIYHQWIGRDIQSQQ